MSTTSTSVFGASSTKPIKSILILVAMEAEAMPLITALGLTLLPKPHPSFAFATYGGTNATKSAQITVAVNGKDKCGTVDNVGTTPAAITAFSVINSLQPDLVINAGTAGGFNAKTATIGDVFISTACSHHDRRIPIPGWESYSRGQHTSISTYNLITTLKYKTGIVSTGNSLDYTDRDMEIMLANETSVKDMEAAAIAWVCEQYNIPFFAVKVVTDIVDSNRPSHEEFLENLNSAAMALQSAIPKCIDFIAGKNFNEL